MADATPAAAQSLDRFVQLLDQFVGPTKGGRGDAIDVILEQPARRTTVVSLRDSPVIQQFRGELIDGLIRADTLNQVLRVASMVLEKIPIP